MNRIHERYRFEKSCGPAALLILLFVAGCAGVTSERPALHVSATELGLRNFSNAYVKMSESSFDTFDVDIYLGHRTSGSSGQDALEIWALSGWILACPLWVVAKERGYSSVRAELYGDGPIRAPITGRVAFGKQTSDARPVGENKETVYFDTPELQQAYRNMCEVNPRMDAKMLGLSR